MASPSPGDVFWIDFPVKESTDSKKNPTSGRHLALVLSVVKIPNTKQLPPSFHIAYVIPITSIDGKTPSPKFASVRHYIDEHSFASLLQQPFLPGLFLLDDIRAVNDSLFVSYIGCLLPEPFQGVRTLTATVLNLFP